MDHTFTFRLSFLLYWNCIFTKLVISRDRWAGYVLFSVLKMENLKLRCMSAMKIGG